MPQQKEDIIDKAHELCLSLGRNIHSKQGISHIELSATYCLYVNGVWSSGFGFFRTTSGRLFRRICTT
jgi:hypothetical protein